jgi:hypothetical protein
MLDYLDRKFDLLALPPTHPHLRRKRKEKTKTKQQIILK